MIHRTKWMLGIMLGLILPLNGLDEINDEIEAWVNHVADDSIVSQGTSGPFLCENDYVCAIEDMMMVNDLVDEGDAPIIPLVYGDIMAAVAQSPLVWKNIPSALDGEDSIGKKRSDEMPLNMIKEKRTSRKKIVIETIKCSHTDTIDSAKEYIDKETLPDKKRCLSREHTSMTGTLSGCIPKPLKKQRAKVHKEKIYPCEAEGCTHAPFKDGASLRRHREAVHEGKRYPCDVLGCTAQPFREERILKRHKKNMHERKKYSCEIEGCKAQPFNALAYLKKHMKNMHKRKHYWSDEKQDNHTEADLMSAAESSNWLIIDRLLVTGIDCDAVDEQGDTALLKAVRNNAIESVQVLLSCGANRMSMNARGETPLLLAVALGHTEIVQLLLQDAQE